MVQIGNMHIGSAENANETVLTCGEANALWNQLESRYEDIEKTQIWENLAHDQDLKMFIRKELHNTLETQADKLEKLINKFKLPLPYRPPKSVNMEVTSEFINDRFIFNDIITGVENAMSHHLHSFRTCISNDPLRHIFMEFITKEMEIYDDLCKYGKAKGWLSVSPLHH